MTIKYKNVYLKNTATIVGPYEANGPLKEYFDQSYIKDLYFETNSWEKAEAKNLFHISFPRGMQLCLP